MKKALFKLSTTWPGRVIRALALVLLSTMLLFILLQALPGDAASAYAGDKGVEVAALLREKMGLDTPMPVRYWRWLSALVQGDLGTTLFSGQPVTEIIQTPLLSTLTLSSIVFLGILLITLPMSLHFSYRHQRAGRVLSGFGVGIAAVPEFITAIFFLALFSQALKWLPVLSIPGPGKTIWDKPITLILPALTLWVVASASLFRRMYALITVQTKIAYIREAELAGLSHRRILFWHLLPSARNGITQLLAQTVPYLLGGAVVIENVTSFPGLGQSLLVAIRHRETPVVMAIGTFLIVSSAVAHSVADALSAKNTPKKAVAK